MSDPSFDPSNYPRTYGHPRSEKIAGVALAVMGVVIPTVILLADDQPDVVLYAFVTMFAIMFITPLWLVLTQKVVLRPDRLEIHNGITRRIVARADIVQTFGGIKFNNGRLTIWIRLKRGSPIKLDTRRDMGDVFLPWFDGIPDEADAPPVYPRTYYPSRTEKITAVIVGAVFSAGLLVPLFMVPDMSRWMQISLIVLAIACAASPIWTFGQKLILYAERLEVRGVLHNLDIARHQIELIYGEPARLRLRDGRTMLLPAPGEKDWIFQQWFEDIPYKYELFSSNPAFGRTAEDRLKAAQRLARWTERLSWPALAVSLWAFFWPQPYDLCMYILMALPVVTWLAVILSGGRLGFAAHDDRVNFSRFFIGIPAMALAYRGVFDVG